MVKSLRLNEEIWKKLHAAKLDKGYSRVEQVIEEFFNTQQLITKEKGQEYK